MSKKELMQLGFYKGKLTSYSNLTLVMRSVDIDDLSRVMGKLSKDANKKYCM